MVSPTPSDRRSGQDRRANPRISAGPELADPYYCDKCGLEFEFLSQLLTHRNECRGKKPC